MEQKQTTLEQVAKACGVTKMTASRAMRDGTSVAAETRERVRAAARRLGYRPDPFLSGLARRRRGAEGRRATIAYVTQYAGESSFRRWRELPFYKLSFEGARARAEALGYGFEEFSVPASGSSARATKVLESRGYAGLVMAPTQLAAGFSRIAMEEFPVVALGYSLRKPRLHFAVHNHFQTMQDLLHELKGRGYRRPGFAAPLERDARSLHRWSAAFRSWQEFFVRDGDRVPVLLADGDAQLEEALPRWFAREKPDVVVTTLDKDLYPLRSAGLRFPEDTGAAVLSLFPHEVGRVAGYSEDPDSVGRAAVDLLHLLILRGERGAPKRAQGLAVDGVWHEGPSLRAAG